MKTGITDYRKLRLHNLNSEEFRHLKLLVFWPIFGLLFSLLEKNIIPRTYHLVHCALDEMIPFCEYFLIPYLFWFVFIFGMIAYSLLFDVETFKKFMRFVIITYSVTLLIYIIYPTYQDLRPEAFPRDNLLTEFIARFYRFDTNTNVCPSLHVIGSLAVMFAAWNSKHFHTLGWKVAFTIAAVLICLSTVFIKQHSTLDIPPAVAISLAAYPLVYWRKGARRVKDTGAVPLTNRKT